jgi:hypothetical protein
MCCVTLFSLPACSISAWDHCALYFCSACMPFTLSPTTFTFLPWARGSWVFDFHLGVQWVNIKNWFQFSFQNSVWSATDSGFHYTQTQHPQGKFVYTKLCVSCFPFWKCFTMVNGSHFNFRGFFPGIYKQSQVKRMSNDAHYIFGSS